MLKIRIKFTKTGALKYIGHLDVMRFFQKLNRRASIPVAYSEGFSPHQILSFSPPLSLGAESLGEYADIEITEKIKSDEAVKALNEHTVEGIHILSFRELPDKALNAMAAVTAALYRCSLKDDDYIGSIADDMDQLMKKESIVVVKQSKKNEKLVDIKPLIYNFKILEDKKTMEFLLSAGSIDNLKPELIFKALFDEKGYIPSDHFLNVCRIDLYCGSKDNLISLDDVGKDII